MGAENQVATGAVIDCGACGAQSEVNAKFCKGCGHPLYESCSGCARPVLLTQRFCVTCGADQETSRERRRQQYQSWLEDAVAAAKKSNFDKALHLLEKVAEQSDYRFRDSSSGARDAIAKVNALKTRAEATTQQVLARAKQEFDQGNQTEVVRLLESVPPNLLSDDAKKILANVKSYTDQLSALEGEAQSAIAAKDWALVGGLVDQLLELRPDSPKYQRLAEQVAQKLDVRAKQLFEKGRYPEAAAKLLAVPSVCRDAAFEERRSSVLNVEWLSKQFDRQPFASPTLGRLAVRFRKDAPHDSTAEKLVAELGEHLKRSPRQPRMVLPRWKAKADSWMGGNAGWLALPTSVVASDEKRLRAGAGRLHVAIGLALQGLGRGRIAEQLAPKSGLLGKFGKRKNKACWGIDVGSSCLKAVCLEETGGRVRVVDTFVEEYASPCCRMGPDQDPASLIAPAVQKLKAERDLSDAPVWANLAASRLVNRFVRLPPLPDKPALKLLAEEITQKIPIPLEDLSVVQYLGPLRQEDVHGRPSVISAAKKSVVSERLELLSSVGLTVEGLQADPIALVNFAAHEFAERWSNADAESEPDDAETTPSVALIDCGASATTLAIVSGEAHWFWSVETGGEDLTAVLARAATRTRTEAEQFKRDPASLPSPASQYDAVERRLEEVRARIENVFAEALQQNPRFDIRESWSLGGGCLAHGWLPRLMLADRDHS